MLLGSAAMQSIEAGRFIDVQLDGVSGSPDSAELYALVDAADSVKECDEANNMIHIPFEAHLPPGRIDVSTDAPNYGSNTSVGLQADITNTGLLGAAYSVELLIRDADGALVVRFPRQDTGKIAGGGRRSVTQHWSTETVLAGSYRVVAILRSPDGAFVDESQSLFEVLGSDEQGLGVSISATTDKALYHTTDTVRIRALLQNRTPNALLDDVRVLVQVSDPKGTRVFNEEILLSQLPPGARCDRTFPYSYEGSRPGTHTVTVRVLDGKGRELTSDATFFEIAEDFTVALNAELEVKPRELFVNNPLTYTSPVTNGGVAPMDDLGVRVVLVDIENKEEVASAYHCIRVDAGGCRTLTGSFDTRGFEPGPYGCVTQAKVNDKWVTLAHAVFEMKEPTAGSIAPEIALRHGTMNILDGGGPVDFGHTASKLPVDKTFTVTNEGGEALTLSRLISVPQGFSVRSPFSSTTLPPAKQAEFTLRLDARRPGDFGGQVSFESNDPDENPFNFKIRGKVTAQVTNVSVDGKTVPDGSGRVTFESPELGNLVRRTFTVQNMTTRDVTLSDPSLPSCFTFVGTFPDTVPAGGRVTFEVQFDAGRWGVTGGILSFFINEDAANPYECMVVGVVCGNICDAPGEGIHILPDTCFVDAGLLAGTGGMARILGVVAAKKPDAAGPVESTAVLTPAPDATCAAFAWTVYDWSGEDITAEAGRSFLNGRCYGFSLLNAPGYYYVEARCTELLDELHAFGLMILP
jgi:hypothetical protein